MAIQRYRSLSMWFCLTLALPVHADEAAASMSQFMQLNRSTQQQLKNIQDSPGRPVGAQQEPGADQLDRQQVGEQQLLQERQRRELLMQNQRARTGADAGLPPGPQSIQQQQFRRQQQNQLNRFRIQQGSSYR